MGYGWLVNDLMTFWMHLMLDAHFGKMTRRQADDAFATFIGAYSECRTISDAELSLLPYLGVGFWLFYMGFHTTHDQFSYWLQPELLKGRTAMVKAVLEKAGLR
jgi:Ser/Thr protein kinase RdoA (MazF antagonist)